MRASGLGVNHPAAAACAWFLSVQPNCLFSRSVVPVCATQLPLQPVCGSCLCSRTASSAGLWFLSVQTSCLFSRSVVPVCADELPLQPVCGSCLCRRAASSAGLWFLSVQPNCLFSRSVVPVCAAELPLQPVCGSCLCRRAASSAGLWFLSLQPNCLGLFSRSAERRPETPRSHFPPWNWRKGIVLGMRVFHPCDMASTAQLTVKQTDSVPNSKQRFTTAFFGGRCRKAVLGVWRAVFLALLCFTLSHASGGRGGGAAKYGAQNSFGETAQVAWSASGRSCKFWDRINKGRVTSEWQFHDEILDGFVGGFRRCKKAAKVGRVAICPQAEEDGEQRGGRDTPLLSVSVPPSCYRSST